MKDLNNRRILVAVSGGIAAYKVVDVVRQLLKRGADVRVIMTHAATRFLHPTTFSAISGNDVGLTMFNEDGKVNLNHLEMSHWADLILLAPATANIIAKTAIGMADDLVSTALLAARCPVMIAPAMNPSMYLNDATQANLETLKNRGIIQIGPNSGEMAAPGELAGPGRLSEPDEIVKAIAEFMGSRKVNRLSGKRVLITAGRTEEPIDQVRVITNRSSGRMGIELAKVALSEGAEVVFVNGPMDFPAPDGVINKPVKTAIDMLDAVNEEIKNSDIVLYVAAVADWRPETTDKGKLKREKMDGLPSIKLVENPDIAKETAKLTKGMAVGFALEMENSEELAIGKLKRKGLDAILLNTVSAIGSSDNKLTWIDVDGGRKMSDTGSKSQIAKWIFESIIDRFKSEENF
jgi:phosphopantothenoylcysteine decarboxylase / phosphopantothenate---cysteine ligase